MLRIAISENCAECSKPIRSAYIEADHDRDDVAWLVVRCPTCDHERSSRIDLKSKGKVKK